MGYYIERALSSRARCKDCKEKIKQDELKVVYEGQGYQYPIRNNYCKKCGKELIEKDIKRLNKILKELKNEKRI